MIILLGLIFLFQMIIFTKAGTTTNGKQQLTNLDSDSIDSTMFIEMVAYLLNSR